MSGSYSILLGTLLDTLLAFIVNILSNWVWIKLFKNNIKYINVILLMAVMFFIIILAAYTQYPIPSLPSGIDTETTTIKASWNNKGVALYSQGNYIESISCYDEAIKIDPGYVLAWSNKGKALKALHRDAEAESAFAKARGGI